MIFNLHLHTLSKRLIMGIGCSVCCGFFLWWTLLNFVLDVVTDPRLNIPPTVLATAAQYFPHSGHVQGRLAARLLETPLGEEQDEALVLSQAERAAVTAVSLLPMNYENHLLLATVKERKDEIAAAEKAMQMALQLAPYHVEVHWRAGNLLLRAEKMDQAIQSFRLVVAADPARTAQIFALLWEATDGKTDAIKRLAHNDSRLLLSAALFLLGKAQPTEAVQLYKQANPATRQSDPESAAFLQALITENKILAAHSLWQELMEKPAETNLLWNGSFENYPHETLNQFDWFLTPNQYAQIAVSTERAHTGRAALKITFTGADTTRLVAAIRQLAPVQPGKKYHLEAYCLTTDLNSTEPVNFVIKPHHSAVSIATSAAIKAGGDQWQRITLSFLIPNGVNGVTIEIQRVPQFSYDAPTTGTIWFDDVLLREL